MVQLPFLIWAKKSLSESVFFEYLESSFKLKLLTLFHTKKNIENSLFEMFLILRDYARTISDSLSVISRIINPLSNQRVD